MAELTRRSLIRGIGIILAAPAIVRVASLMPVRVPPIVRAVYLPSLDEIWRPHPLSSGVSLTEIRSLLLPGLQEIIGSYNQIPAQWARVFMADAKGGS